MKTSTPSAAQPRDLTAAVEAFRRGQLVLVYDSRRPERGGIVTASAERTSDDVVNFMATYARGLVCVALTPLRCERLGLFPQGEVDDLERERFSASIEAREGTTTGISAADRARTIQTVMDPRCHAEDLVSPGHVFPACAEADGVLARPGWAEVGIDLARIAGVAPAASFCRVLDDEGEIAQGQALLDFAATHALPHLTVSELVAHRMATESFVTQLSQTALPVGAGEFVVRAFQDRLTKRQHLALSLGDVRSSDPILVRLHSECLTGDVFGSRRCDCGQQLAEGLARVQAEGRGVVLYLRQEGRGIGLANKVRAYQLQDQGRDTVEANEDLGLPADPRDYGVAAQMLIALGVRRVRLMTNNPKKIEGLEMHGVEVVSREPIEITPSEDNLYYLTTKKVKMGHLLDIV